MNDTFYIPGSGFFPDSNGSYYGAYRTRTFTQIFSEDGETSTFEAFLGELENTPFHDRIIKDKTNNPIDVELIYYMLYARYGNSHIAYSDEGQFKYALFNTIFMYGPSWAKRLDIQDKLRDLTDEELTLGSKAIYNHAYNPGTAPSTATLEELTAINDQNTSHYKKSKIEGYATLLDVLRTDVSEDFIDKFAKLFIKVLAPDYPLYYATEE